MNRDNRDLGYTLKLVFIISLLATLVVPIVLVSFYAYPYLDDFTNSLGWVNSDGNKLAYIFRNSFNIYNNWQGTYLGNALCSISIYALFGLAGVRIVYLINVMFFFYSSYSLTRSAFFSRNKDRGRLFSLMILFFGLLYLFSINSLGEVFYWWTGICVYTLPVSFVLLSISCYIAYRDKRRKIYLFTGIILAFLGAGGALNVTALLCGVLAYFTIRDFFITRKLDKSMLFFMSSFIGALINTAAPGNYVRHLNFDNRLRVVDAIANSVLRASAVLSRDYIIGFLLMAMAVAFVIGYVQIDKKECSFNYPGIVSIAGVVIIILTEFPVMLGYSTLYVPERCEFVEQLAMTMICIYVSFYWGGWCKTNNSIQLKGSTIFVLFFVTAIQIFPYISIYNLRELTPYKMIWHLSNGDYADFSTREDQIINDIKEFDGTDVVLHLKHQSNEKWVNFAGIGLDDGETNSNIANYFGKDSITIIYDE